MKKGAQPTGAKRKASLLGLDVESIPKQFPTKRACKQKQAPTIGTVDTNRFTFYGCVSWLYVLIQPLCYLLFQ